MKIDRTLLSMTVLLFLAACGADDAPSDAPMEAPEPQESQEMLTIRGEMYYLERIGLAPESTAIVELRDGTGPSANLLAVSSEPLNGRQVPIAFELGVATDSLQGVDQPVFRAGIVSGRSDLRASEAVSIDQQSGELDLGELRIRPVSQVGFGTPYLCGDRAVVLGAFGKETYLSAESQVFLLQHEVSASGARYVATDAPDTSIWTKGREATVILAGEELPACEQFGEPSLPFVALGHEPGWRLTIDQSAMELLADYGKETLNFPRVDPSISTAGLRYESERDGQTLTVLVDRRVCRDTMVDLVYPYRVRYTLEGQVRVGCGGDPREILTGDEWSIEQIGDEPVITGTAPTIVFFNEDGADRFSGLASCNRFMGGYSVVGEGLRFTPAASTLMACIDEQQALQERRLLTLLGEVSGFGIDEEGRLLLRTGGGDIVARR
jgi:heat shock protein HslJ/uncharacterized lipoprotein YbaY